MQDDEVEVATDPRIVVEDFALVQRVAKAIAVRAALTSFAPGIEEWYRDLARAALNEMRSPGSDSSPGRRVTPAPGKE